MSPKYSYNLGIKQCYSTLTLTLYPCFLSKACCLTQGAGRIANELVANDEGLRQAVGAGLHCVLQVEPPLAAVTQQLLKARGVISVLKG